MKVCQLLSTGANWLALCHRDHLAATLRWYHKHSSAVTDMRSTVRNTNTSSQWTLCVEITGDVCSPSFTTRAWAASTKTPRDNHNCVRVCLYVCVWEEGCCALKTSGWWNTAFCHLYKLWMKESWWFSGSFPPLASSPRLKNFGVNGRRWWRWKQPLFQTWLAWFKNIFWKFEMDLLTAQISSVSCHSAPPPSQMRAPAVLRDLLKTYCIFQHLIWV